MELEKKLYSNKAISIATYFGGPIAAGFLIKKNYNAFEQKENGKKAFFISIIATLLIFTLIYLIPDQILDKIPNALIPIIYTGLIYLIVEKIQGQRIKEHKEMGGKFHSAWKATGIGAIFIIFIMFLIFGIAFISGDFSEPNFNVSTYDKEISNFVENENKSIAVFNVINSAERSYLIKEFKKGIKLWEENKNIIYRINNIENLPTELLEQNKKLLKYCDLRIKHNTIIVKAISEDTDKYNSEIGRIEMEINLILDELNN